MSYGEGVVRHRVAEGGASAPCFLMRAVGGVGGVVFRLCVVLELVAGEGDFLSVGAMGVGVNDVFQVAVRSCC